jgi:transposase-like protein
MQHSDGFKARMVERMSGPEAISATALADDVGVAQGTLSRWLRAARSLDGMSTNKPRTPKSTSRTTRSAEDKVRLVMAAAALSDDDLGTFLRREGIHEAQLEEWRAAAMSAAVEGLKTPPRHGRKSLTPEARRIRELERELGRKEQALAELAALHVLQKKVNAWNAADADAGTAPSSDTK